LRKFLAFVFAGVFLLMFQMCLADALRMGPYAPDLLLATVVYMGIFRNPFRGALIVFLLGYLVDLLSSGILGISGVGYLAIFFLTRLVGRIFYARNMTFPIIMTLICSFVQRLLVVAVLKGYPGFEGAGSIDWGPLLVRSAISAAVAPLLFRLLFVVEAVSTKGYLEHRTVDHRLR